jgi:hypothetical protein
MSRCGRAWQALKTVVAVGLSIVALQLLLPLLQLVLVLIWVDPFNDAPLPSDAALQTLFAQHRGELDELRQMMQQDAGLQRVGPDFTRPEDPAGVGVSPARLARYRQLLRAAGVEQGLLVEGGEIDFLVGTRGLAVSGSAKGFAWSVQPDPGATLVEGDLDAAFDRLADKRALIERPLDGPWRLRLDAR